MAGKDSLEYHISLPKGLDLKKLSARATMYYQAIPPYYLHQRFTTAPGGDATRRLYYLASHLKTQGTAIEDWKLPLFAEQATVKAYLPN